MNNDAFISNADIRPIEFLQDSFQMIKDRYWLFVGICAIALILASYVPLGILLGPMFCGIYLCFFKQMNGQDVEFGDLFKGFDFFLESFIVSILITLGTYFFMAIVYLILIFGVFGAAFGASAMGNEAGAVAGIVMVLSLLFCSFFVLILVSILFVFSYPLIVEKGMKAVDAMTLSAKAVRNNFFGILMLMIVNSILAFFACLLCYLPVFLVFPIIFGSMAIAYRKVFPQLA